MLNQCTLTGNLGADPEVFYNPEGNPVTSFNIAFHSSKKKTGWIKVVCFQKLAEVASHVSPQRGQNCGYRDTGSTPLGVRRGNSEKQLSDHCQHPGIHQDGRERI